MGDRANIVIRDDFTDDLHDKEAVFLYSHWGGNNLPETLRAALEAQERWGDSSYLARMIFSHMIAEDIDGATGYGISTRLTDNEYDLLVLFKGRIYLMPEGWYAKFGFTDLDALYSISFEDYIAVPERTWANVVGAGRENTIPMDLGDTT